jgi:hypothetical protein
MVTNYEDDGRALAYIGSIFLSVGIVVFGGFAFLCRELLHSLRERRADVWQPTTARVTSGDVTAIHGRGVDYAIGNIGYAFSVQDAYFSGYVTRQFWDEQRAWEFVDGCQNRQVMVAYKPSNPQASVLALRDLSNTDTNGSRRFQRNRPLSPWLGLLWRLRNVSDWAEGALQKQATNWPSAEATVEYAEPMMVGEDDDLHWVGDLHYKYSVDGCSYSGSQYFRALGGEDAREQVEVWRGLKLAIHYFPGNPGKSVFIASEQEPSQRLASSG